MTNFFINKYDGINITQNSKVFRNLIILIFIFFILASAYIIINPVFEGPDASGHFAYVAYIAINNKLPTFITWGGESEAYVREHHSEAIGKNYLFLLNGDHAFTKGKSGDAAYMSMEHQPPLYYLISSILIKPFSNLSSLEKIRIERGDGYNINYYFDDSVSEEDNNYIDGRLLLDKSGVFSSVYFLKFIQVIYGILILIFTYKILKTLLGKEFNEYSVLVLSCIYFLPSLLFLCNYVNNDILAILFGIISIYYIILLQNEKTIKYGYLSLFFSLLALITKYHTIAILAFNLVYFLIWLIKNRKVKHYLSIFAFFFFIVINVLILVLCFSEKDSAFVMHFKRAFFDRIKYSLIYSKGLFSRQFLEFIPKVGITAIASFDINHVIADNFVYYFYYSFILCGFLLLFKNVKTYSSSLRKIFLSILVVIFLVLLVMSLYNTTNGFASWGARLIFVAIILIFILAILGFEKLELKIKKYLYPALLIFFILLNIFCIYEYIYLFFYKNIIVNFVLY